MKASVKFSENSKPVLRAKVPVTIVGLPFRSAIEAGNGDDISFSFSTFFRSGPLLKLLYRPYDSFKPFSFVVKTGLGPFGSPFAAPMTMSAEFNLLGNSTPAFLLNFRPNIGDFSVRRSVTSDLDLDDDAAPFSQFKVPKSNSYRERSSVSVEFDETPVKRVAEEGGFSGNRTLESVFSGTEVNARTLLPVKDRALVKFRWRMKLPEVREIRTGGFPFSVTKPSLALSKIGIVHVASNPDQQKTDEVAEACLAVKKELQVLQVERNYLRKAVDELRAVICPAKLGPVAGNHTSGKPPESGGGNFLSGKKWKGDQKSTENNLVPSTAGLGNAKSGGEK